MMQAIDSAQGTHDALTQVLCSRDLLIPRELATQEFRAISVRDLPILSPPSSPVDYDDGQDPG